MLVQRVGDVRGKKKQSQIQLTADKMPPAADDLAGYQACRQTVGHMRAVKNLIPADTVQKGTQRHAGGC